MASTPTQVLIGVPTTGRVVAETTRTLQRMIATTRSTAQVDLALVTAAPVEVARHRLVEAFLADPDASHLMFVDSDMGLPADALDRLLRLEAAIACLPCPMFAPPAPDGSVGGPSVTSNVWLSHSLPETAPEDRIVRYLEPDEFPDGPFECFGTGLACCLIRREVFERIGLPMFAVTFDRRFSATRIGEDAHFFAKAADAGFRIQVDPGAMCDHFKEVDITHLEAFYSETPIRWSWNVGIRPKRPESVFVACVTDGGTVHTETLGYLAAQSRRTGRECDVFAAQRWSAAAKDAMRHFLARRSEDRLFLLDPDTVPPNDFLDRLLADPRPLMSGLFRELVDHEPTFAVARREADGTWRRYEEYPDPQAGAFEVDAFSLRVVLIERSLLTRLGTGWLRPGATPFEAGAALCDAARNRCAIRPVVAPVGCSRYVVMGLRSLLAVKGQLRARLRGDPQVDDAGPNG